MEVLSPVEPVVSVTGGESYVGRPSKGGLMGLGHVWFEVKSSIQHERTKVGTLKRRCPPTKDPNVGVGVFRKVHRVPFPAPKKVT